MPSNLNELSVHAGELRRRLKLQRLINSQDETGGQIRSWVDVKEVWGKIEPLSGRELSNAAQLYPEADVHIQVRFDPDFPIDQLSIDAWRVVDQYNNQYDILNVADIEMRHIVLDIISTQRPPGRNA